jgi:hypothetical protein
MAISQDAFTAISFLALCMDKKPEQKDKKDRNIETLSAKMVQILQHGLFMLELFRNYR